MSSVSLPAPRSISQSSQAIQKSILDQGINEKASFRNLNEKFLFPFYDELFRMVKLHPFFPVFLAFVFLDQVFTISGIFINIDLLNFFANFHVSTAFEMISTPFLYLLINIVFFIYLFYSYRSKRIFSFWHLYVASLLLNFFNVMFFPPICGLCGYSVYKINTIVNAHYSVISTFQERKIPRPINISVFPNGIHNRFLYPDINLTLFQNSTDYYKNNDKNNPKTIEKINISRYFYKKYREYLENKNIQSFSQKSNKNNENIFLTNENNHKNPDPGPSLPDEIIDKNNPHDNRTINQDEENYLLLFLNSDFSRHLFVLIVSLFEVIIIFFQIFYNFHFMSESPYLNRTIFSMWDSQVFTLFIVLLGINQFSFYFLKILPNWCTLFYQVVILIFIIYILYYTFFQPFIRIGMNIFIQSLLSTIFISTFLSFILWLKSSIIIYLLINFSFFLFFIFLIVFTLIDRKIYKTVDSKLSPPIVVQDQTDSFELNEASSPLIKKFKNNISLKSVSDILLGNGKHESIVELTEQEKRELFDSYVFQSVDHALLYFRVGISRASPYLVDFSFMRYMKECYGQKPIQFFILQLSSLFPSQHQFFSFCMTSFGKKIDFFNVFENFLMYQLNRINVIRQSSVSKEVQNELVRLEKMSDDTISTIRGFWSELLQAKTELNTASLGFIRKMTMSTKSSYIDAIEKFPNSQQILNSYCRFLCEANGDFIECARVGQKMRLIEQGKNLNADHCYHSFVNVFPHYLKKRILDVKGSFIMNLKGPYGSSESSASLSSDRLSASFDNARGMAINSNLDSKISNFAYKKHVSNKKQYKEEFDNLIEQEHFETLINTLFSKGKQRLTIQQIVDRSQNSALNLARVLSIIQCFVAVSLLSISSAYLATSLSTINLMSSSTRVLKIASIFQYCSLIAGVQYMTEKYNKNISSMMKHHLDIRDENLPTFACTFIYPIVSLNNMKNTLTELFDDEMKFLMMNPKDHKQEIKTYTGLSIDSQSLKSLYLNLSLNNISQANSNGTRYDTGIILYKFNDLNATGFKLTLRNGIEYFISSVERLAFEKTLFLIHQYYINGNNNATTPPQSPNGSKLEITKEFINELSNDDLILLEDQVNVNVSEFFDSYYDLLYNGLTLSEPFLHLFKIISNNAIQITSSYSTIFRILSEITIVLFGAIFFVARTYDYILIRQSNKITSIVLQKLKEEDIIKTKKPIYLKSKKGIKIISTGNHSFYDYSPTLVLYPIVTFFSIMGFLAFFSISVFIFIHSLPFVESAFQWASDGASRFLSLAKLLNGMISDRIGIFDLNITNELTQIGKELLSITHKLDLSLIGQSKDLDSFYFMINNDILINIEELEYNITNLSISSAPKTLFKNKKIKTKSSSSYKIHPLAFESLDQALILSTTKCNELNNSDTSTQMNFATYLDCISIENKINLAIHFYNLLQNSIANSTDDLTEIPEFMATLFIIDKYLFTDLPNFQELIEHITSTKLNTQEKKSYTIFIFGIVFCIILMLIEQLLIIHFYYSYDAFKQLIMVLPPNAFTNNSCLINFLISTYSNMRFFIKPSNNVMNTISKISHIHGNMLSEEEILANAVDHAVISICKDLIIQSVNPATQKMTGFQSDQLLGQGLIYLIPLTSQKEKTKMALEISPFYQRLEEIKSNSGDHVAEVNTTCLTDKGDEILVQATIIGIFEKKDASNDFKNSMHKPNQKSKSKETFFDVDENELSESEMSTSNTTNTSNTTENKSTNVLNTFNRHRANNINENEEFVGATIILKDISIELSQKKEMKETKKKTEVLINLLIPPPVLESIRASQKHLFYHADNATLIKIELCGLNDYIGSIMPKQIMLFLQHVFTKIAQINQTEQQMLFTGRKNNHNIDGNIISYDSTNNHDHYQFNFNFNFSSVADEGDIFFTGKNSFDEINKNKNKQNEGQQQQFFDSSDENLNDNDDICDFNCIYNIRNDHDNFISIAGLFDTSNDLQKQAESCVRYALNVRKIMEEISLEEQINLFIHARIVVCMGGPVEGIVEDPQKPNIEIITCLMDEADKIRDSGELDVVYINEKVYENIVKENYEIEEKIVNAKENDENDENQFVCDFQKIYQVNRCLRKKNNNEFSLNDLINNNLNPISNSNNNNVFVIQCDSQD